MTFPLTQDLLNYTCRGNNNDDTIFVGVLNAIISVLTKVFKRILNIKDELLMIIITRIIAIYIVVMFILHILLMNKVFSSLNFIQYDFMIVFR